MSKLTYIRCGDYDIPNLKLSEQPETSIGKYDFAVRADLRQMRCQDHSPNRQREPNRLSGKKI